VAKADSFWRWLNRIDPWFFDACLAIALGTGAIFDWTYSHDPLWRLPLQLIVTCSVLIRRRGPLLALGLAIGGALALQVSPGAEGLAAVLINAYSVGRHSTTRWRSLAVVLLVTAIAASASSRGGALVLPVAWLIGDMLRERAAAKAAQIEAANRGAADERARIARDLHDVIAHGVAVMVVQAEGARNVLDRDPEHAKQAIETIAATGRDALAELRQLLQVLRVSDADDGLRPLPGVDDINALVDRVRAAGQPVALHVEGQPQPLPPAIGLAAFRVVQEGLTNAVKYAPGAPTEVRVIFGSDLLLEVLDVGAPDQAPLPSGARRGLAGLRERIGLLGGQVTAGTTQIGGYALTATIPIEKVGS
jgi:signal transduction histidine kinase